MQGNFRWIMVLAGVAAISVLVAGFVLRDALPLAHSAAAPTQPGPIDIGFAQSMTLHHQQAIAMSQLMLETHPAGSQRSPSRSLTGS